jgi:hypothetical protein
LFKRNSPYETYQAVIECAVDAPSRINNQLDPALDAIVMKAVAKDKDKRYPSAEAFGDAMLGYLHHRGKGSGGNELGRFFEQYFGQEIDEHGERMRELISGRDFSVDTGVGWDEGEDRGNQTVDLGGRKAEDASISLATGEIMELRPSEASLDAFVDDLEPPDPDAMPADKTNIVQNPLEAIAQLDQQVARNSSRTPVPSGSVTGLTGTGGPAPLPAPPTGPTKAITGPTKTVAGGKRASFPDLPNLPTQMAPETMARAETQRPENLPTAIGARSVNPASAGLRTQAEIPVQKPQFDQVEQAGPQSSTHYAVAPSGPNVPTSPSNPAVLHDYPVMPGGQRPFSTDLAPSHFSSAPQRSPFANAPFDPGAAASLMSPVGEHYPQTDWERAASMSAKALPTWVLVALFGGALLAALLLTLIIAKIFS